MKLSTQCAVAVKKAHSALGIIREAIENKMFRIVTPLYKSLVQLHLMYSAHSWSPHLEKDTAEQQKSYQNDHLSCEGSFLGFLDDYGRILETAKILCAQWKKWTEVSPSSIVLKLGS